MIDNILNQKKPHNNDDKTEQYLSRNIPYVENKNVISLPC